MFTAFHQAIPGCIEDRGEKLWLKLGIATDQPDSIFVRIEPDNEEYLIEMTEIEKNGDWTYYAAEVSKSSHISQTDYLFKLVWSDRSAWLGSAGVEPHMPRNIHMYRYSHDRRMPFWSASQIYYQIFPDRFSNGDPEITPKIGEYKYLNKFQISVKEWGEAPSNKSGGFEFFGGDLIGLESKLDYLHNDLGVTALYLNPIFTSQSSHKYDTVDYFNVDSHFGGNAALESLVTNMKSRGMKIILDSVINHTSIMHPWFQSALAGNENDKARYVFESDGDYRSWKEHKSLPTLDYSNEQNVTDLITGKHSAIRHWLQPPYAIDGWRMDVVHMMGEGAGAKNNSRYLNILRGVIKEENSNAMLLGEHFFEATSWLQGDQEDCAMNYFGFAHPIRAFLAGVDIAGHPIQLEADLFSKWLREARARISFSHQLLQFNQLDSHDTSRFITFLKEDKQLIKLALGFLMSYIGTPCLYYGTEIGMSGGEDPDNRRSFPWDQKQWDQDIFKHTKKWIDYRKNYPSLSTGAIIDVFAKEDVMVFSRLLEGEQTLIVLNRGKEKEINFSMCLPNLSGCWEQVSGETELTIQNDNYSLLSNEKSIELWVRRN